MTFPQTQSSSKPAQSIQVYRAEDFVGIDGTNIDEALSFADEIQLDDVYEQNPGTQSVRLMIVAHEQGRYRIASGTEVGQAGADVVVDCCLTMMREDGSTIELILMVELDDEGMVAELYVLPLAQLVPQTAYRLVGLDRDGASRKLAEVACVAFTRGTKITLSTGAQKPIEELQVGDRLLTRDDGAQQIRWIGHSTVRAIGDFAPIVIKAGTLNNSEDLVVSPDHRLFIYQRSDELGAGRSEVLVKARHLVNGESVYQQAGGFVDYFQLLFDEHQIVYAEGIAAETQLVDIRTKPAIADDVSADVMTKLSNHTGYLHHEFEVSADLLGPDAAEKLRLASKR